jgi:hypothetical protein
MSRRNVTAHITAQCHGAMSRRNVTAQRHGALGSVRAAARLVAT